MWRFVSLPAHQLRPRAVGTHSVDAYRPKETLPSGSLIQQGATPLWTTNRWLKWWQLRLFSPEKEVSTTIDQNVSLVFSFQTLPTFRPQGSNVFPGVPFFCGGLCVDGNSHHVVQSCSGGLRVTQATLLTPFQQDVARSFHLWRSKFQNQKPSWPSGWWLNYSNENKRRP